MILLCDSQRQTKVNSLSVHNITAVCAFNQQLSIRNAVDLHSSMAAHDTISIGDTIAVHST